MTLQNHYFSIAAGKLVERIHSPIFEKVVHQEIKVLSKWIYVQLNITNQLRKETFPEVFKVK